MRRTTSVGVLATSALALAFVDQTLHAVQAADPDLVDPVQRAQQVTCQVITGLRNSHHGMRTWPTEWANHLQRFVAAVDIAAGPQTWVQLRNRLGAPQPGSGEAGAQPGPSGSSGSSGLGLVDPSAPAGDGLSTPMDLESQGPVDFGPVDYDPLQEWVQSPSVPGPASPEALDLMSEQSVDEPAQEFDESGPDARRWYRMLSDQSPARPEPAPVVSDRDHPAAAVSATPTPDFAAAMVEPTETS